MTRHPPNKQLLVERGPQPALASHFLLWGPLNKQVLVERPPKQDILCGNPRLRTPLNKQLLVERPPKQGAFLGNGLPGQAEDPSQQAFAC